MNPISLIYLFLTLTCVHISTSLPVTSDSRVILVPLSYMASNQQPRGPFDFIGNWLQNTGFIPVEINVPDVFSGIGSTVGGWATNVGNFAQNVGTTFQGLTQNVGNGIQGVTQNVGNGVQTFAQGLTQNVPILGAFIRPNGGQTTQRYVILVPTQNFPDGNKMNQNVRPDFNFGADALDIFP